MAEYLNIYANLVTPIVHTSEIRELIKKPRAAKDKSTNDLVSDFYTITQTITEQTQAPQTFRLIDVKKSDL